MYRYPTNPDRTKPRKHRANGDHIAVRENEGETLKKAHGTQCKDKGLGFGLDHQNPIEYSTAKPQEDTKGECRYVIEDAMLQQCRAKTGVKGNEVCNGQIDIPCYNNHGHPY